MVRLLLGTQWYILFNVIAGATAIPSHRPIEVIRGYEAEAADDYACAFTGFVRLERI
jgi:ABC-type anion transport system duplicated permease subunit